MIAGVCWCLVIIILLHLSFLVLRNWQWVHFWRVCPLKKQKIKCKHPMILIKCFPLRPCLQLASLCSALGGFGASRARWWSLWRWLSGTSPSDRQTGGCLHSSLGERKEEGAREERWEENKQGEDFCIVHARKSRQINKLLRCRVEDGGSHEDQGVYASRVKERGMLMIKSHVRTFNHLDWRLVCPIFQMLVWFLVLVKKQIWIFCKTNIFRRYF